MLQVWSADEWPPAFRHIHQLEVHGTRLQVLPPPFLRSEMVRLYTLIAPMCWLSLLSTSVLCNVETPLHPCNCNLQRKFEPLVACQGSYAADFVGFEDDTAMTQGSKGSTNSLILI